MEYKIIQCLFCKNDSATIKHNRPSITHPETYQVWCSLCSATGPVGLSIKSALDEYKKAYPLKTVCKKCYHLTDNKDHPDFKNPSKELNVTVKGGDKTCFECSRDFDWESYEHEFCSDKCYYADEYRKDNE